MKTFIQFYKIALNLGQTVFIKWSVIPPKTQPPNLSFSSVSCTVCLIETLRRTWQIGVVITSVHDQLDAILFPPSKHIKESPNHEFTQFIKIYLIFLAGFGSLFSLCIASSTNGLKIRGPFRTMHLLLLLTSVY